MSARDTKYGLRRQSGLSMIELLVAMVISLLLLAGVVQIFTSSKSTYRTQEALSRIQENARFAIDFVNRRVRLAGYMGCLSVGSSIFESMLNDETSFALDFENAVGGFEANDTNPGTTYAITATNPAPSATAGDWTPALDADLVGRVLPGTDVIVIRNASVDSFPLVSPFNNGAQVFVESPNDFARGEILIATDCVKSTAFQATNVSDVGFGTNVAHSSAAMTPGNADPTWPIPAQQYGAGSEIMRAETTVYYIGRSASGVPALFQRQLTRISDTESALVSQELVENVENMQVVYGEDTNADGSADTYVSADAVGDWQAVVSVRVAFLLRSGEQVRFETDTGTYATAGTTLDPVDDRRLREVASTTVTLRNRIR